MANKKTLKNLAYGQSFNPAPVRSGLKDWKEQLNSKKSHLSIFKKKKKR